MTPRVLIRLAAAGTTLLVIGWLGLMVSFWLPGYLGHALRATAIALIIPGGAGAVVIGVFWPELTAAKQPKLRCEDCGRKILNAAGNRDVIRLPR